MTSLDAAGRIRNAADALLAARRARKPLDALSESARPHTIDEAWAVQDRIVDALGGRGGWKVGAANPAAEPGASALPKALMHASGARVSASDFNFVGVEGEIAFRFARDLPRRDKPYATSEVLAAVESVHAAIELVDSRLRDWRTQPALVQAADLGNHGAFVLGPPGKARADVDQTAQRAELWVNGRALVARIGANTGGSVQRLVTWLANHCAARDTPLRAGDVVTSGSCTGLDLVTAPADVTVYLPGIGDARVFVT
jgi:2-keto-4-pentenoate hydratase